MTDDYRLVVGDNVDCFYPPVLVVTPGGDPLFCPVSNSAAHKVSAISSRTAPALSLMPAFDASSVLLPITPTGTMLAVVSPRHLQRATNASPSVSSWAGGESSRHQVNEQPLLLQQKQQLEQRNQRPHHHLTSNFNVLTTTLQNAPTPAPTSCPTIVTSDWELFETKGVLAQSDHEVEQDSFGDIRWTPTTSERKFEGFGDRVGTGGTGLRQCGTHAKGGDTEIQMSNYSDNDTDRFMDNPNIDEFLVGSVSQQSLVGKQTRRDEPSRIPSSHLPTPLQLSSCTLNTSDNSSPSLCLSFTVFPIWFRPILCRMPLLCI